MNASQDMSDIIGYLVWVLAPHSCHRVKSRISRRLTLPRKFRRAVLCTSRMSRSSAGPCALRLSCVSPRGSVERGIRERLLIPHGCFSSRWGGRVSFLTACGSRRRHTLCLFHLLHVSACLAALCIWFYVSVICGYRSSRFEEFKTSSPVAAHPS